MLPALVITGTTAGMEVGLDGYSWQVGPKFGGIRNVEGPGLHLLVMAPRNGVGRQAVWLKLEVGDVVAKAWSTKGECIDHRGASPQLEAAAHESLRLAAWNAAASLGLGTYPGGHGASWQRLKSHITEATIARCGLELDSSFSCDEADEDDAAEDDPDDLDGRLERPGPKWTQVPEEGSSSMSRDASAVTRAHMDGSERTTRLVRTAFDRRPSELLGELQLAFVLFFAVGALSGLRQWRRLLALVASCEALMGDDAWRAFYHDLLEAVEAQLELAPADFFRDVLGSSEDAIQPALANLFELLDAARPLFDFVRRKFGWYSEATDLADARARLLFDAARREAPVVVDLRPPLPPEDPRVDLLRRGLPDLAAALDPATEDAAMAAARALDVGPPAAAADAVRYLESLEDGSGGGSAY